MRTALALGLLLAAGCLKVPPDLAPVEGDVSAPTSAAEILSRHITALGGESAVRALTARTVEARMTFLPEEGCEPEDENCLSEEQGGTFVLQTTDDGRLYRRTVLGQLVEERGYDGKNGWQVLSDGTVRLETPQETAVSREDARLHWYFDLTEAGVQATVLPPRDLDTDGATRALDGLRWEVGTAAGTPKTLWFDRQTGLLREEILEEGEGDELSRQTIIYESYESHDGVLAPEKIRLVTEGGGHKRVVEFFTTAISHVAIADETFAIPVPARPPKRPDARLAELDTARKAASAAPKDASVQIAHARAAWKAAHFDEARTAALATLEAERGEPEALWILIREAVLRGEYGEAEKLMRRGKDIRASEIARQRAWILSHRRDYRGMAKALDAAGQPQLAGRYRSFAGKPLQLEMGGDHCTTTLPLKQIDPPAMMIRIRDVEVLALVDTGATDLILGDALARELAVPLQARTSLGPQGPEVGHGQLDVLQLGDATLKNVPVDVFDARAIARMADEPETSRVRAVVGMRTLERFQVTFDIPARAVRLVSRDRKCAKQRESNRIGAPLPFWVHETHFPYVRGAMNGAEGLYLVNTGMRGVDVTANRAAYAHAGIGTPVIVPGKPAVVTVDELTMGDAVKLENASAAFGFFDQDETADGFRIDGMIGLDVLGRTPVTFDFDDRKIYVSPAASQAGTGKPAG